MKRFPLLVLFGISTLLFRCFFPGKKIVYGFENNGGKFNFQSTFEDSVIQKSIGFWTMELNESKDEPVGINFIYSEAPLNAEKFHSVETQLYYFTKNNEKVEIPFTSELNIEYFNGKNLIPKKFKNNTVGLNKLIDWNDVNYTYEFLNKQYQKKDNTVTYTFSYDFQPQIYPDTLHFLIKFTWDNGTREYESKLLKTEYVGPKINPKF